VRLVGWVFHGGDLSTCYQYQQLLLLIRCTQVKYVDGPVLGFRDTPTPLEHLYYFPKFADVPVGYISFFYSMRGTAWQLNKEVGGERSEGEGEPSFQVTASTFGIIYHLFMHPSCREHILFLRLRRDKP
jgi:hypothetical protein